MDDTNLPPTGDMSVDPTRDTPQKDGGDRYLNWNLDSACETFEPDERKIVVSLGATVVSRWAELPRNVQKTLFEAATGPASADIRESLAMFLHDRGERHE